MTRIILTPRAGVTVGDGVVRLHRLVGQLVADGDRRGQAARQEARRTLAEMPPEHIRPPLLVLYRPRMNDACAICGVWSCKGNCWSASPAGATTKAVSR